MRLKPGEKAVLVDEDTQGYLCLLKKYEKNKIIFSIEERLSAAGKAKISLTIACAIPKKIKMDDIVDKLTQLGVDKIIPMLTERVVIKWDAEKIIAQEKRWRKIALSASQQSQRVRLPVVEPVKGIKEVLSEAKNYDLKLIPTLSGSRKPLKEIFAHSRLVGGNGSGNRVMIFIGPEGDFTDAEVALAIKSGCISVTLGDNVLRVDTAAIAAASFIKLYANG